MLVADDDSIKTELKGHASVTESVAVQISPEIVSLAAEAAA